MINIKHKYTGATLASVESLTGANLAGANLAGANLARANLARANLARANLTSANLAGANLAGANLTYANLTYADLTYADLADANLADANLADANLTGANLAGAYLAGANLARANLARANLAGAYLAGAIIDEKTRLPPISILPEGDLIGWKKLRNGVIAKIKIPDDAARVNSTGRKCRAAYVKTLALFDKYGAQMPKTSVIGGSRDDDTKYKAGRITKPDSFDPDWRVECSHGIHFFITRAEAEAY